MDPLLGFPQILRVMWLASLAINLSLSLIIKDPLPTVWLLKTVFLPAFVKSYVARFTRHLPKPKPVYI